MVSSSSRQRNIRLILRLSKFLAACLLVNALAHSQVRESPDHGSLWLWVVDEHTSIGIAGARVEIAPGPGCVKGEPFPTDAKSIARYVTGPAGRVVIPSLPDKYSCRVTLNGRELPVQISGRSASQSVDDGKILHASIWVDPESRGSDTVEPDYWRTTNNPTQFRAYIDDGDNRLIAGVKIRALRSAVTTNSDANGLFTIAVPAAYRKGKFPSRALETLVFSKPGYRQLEYRDLVLRPGLNILSISLERGGGTAVYRNLSLSNGGERQEFTFQGPARAVPEGYAGEIAWFAIAPAHLDGGWIACEKGAKAILKGRNLQSVEILLYPTGTGLGENGPAKVGQMKKVRSSPDGDTWEVSIPSVLTTNFWAEAIDTNGKTIKSMDLGNVNN